MKSFLLATVALGLSLSVFGVAPSSAQADDDVPSLTACVGEQLEKGSTGPCVRSLQQSLNALGFNLKEDGVYGGLTRLAVKRFQQSQGLSVDGIAGARTIPALDRAANTNPNLVPHINTILPDRKARSVTDDGVLILGVGSSSHYFSRSTTRKLNDYLNDADTGLAKDVGTATICSAAGKIFKPQGAACGGISILISYAVSRTVQDAVNQSACFEIKDRNAGQPLGGVYSTFSVNNGHNCID
jgi:hypothetical protein